MKTENFEARSTDPVTEQSKSKGEEKGQSYKALKIRGIVQDAERKLKTKRRKNKTKAEKRKTLTTLSVNKLMALTSVAHSHHRHHSNNRPKKTQTMQKILKKESSTSTALSPALFLLPPPTSHSQTNSCWLAGFPNPHVIIMLWRSMQEERRSDLRERERERERERSNAPLLSESCRKSSSKKRKKKYPHPVRSEIQFPRKI
jgi:hypothetical protein